MNANIIKNINAYKAKSADKLKDQQIAYIPTLETDQIECTVSSYILDGQRRIFDQSKYLCIKLKYLKFMHIAPRVHLQHINKSWSMEYLVSNSIIHPFAVFINGYCIPWSMISVVIGYDMYYLMIDLSVSSAIAASITPTNIAQIVRLPDNSYEESTIDNIDNTIFTFDSNGKFATTDISFGYVFSSPKLKIYRILNNNPSTNPINGLITDVDKKVELDSDNIVVFKNKLFTTGLKVAVLKGTDAEYHNDEYDIDIPYIGMSSEEITDQNPSVRFDANVLTVTEDDIASDTNYDILIYINKDYSENVNNISKIESAYVKADVEAYNAGTPKNYWNTLKDNFIMNMDRTKDYETNLKEAIKTMMSYNSSFFNEVFKENSNLSIEEYSGTEFLAKADNGVVSLSRHHDIMFDEFILVLHNGSIYEFYDSVSYDENICNIPTGGITESDIVEILRFKNVNNSVYDIVINKDDGFTSYMNNIINDDMILFSTETDNSYFNFPSNGMQHFPVKYNLEKDEYGRTKISLEKSFYYGKKLKLAYKNRFKHFWFMLDGSTDKYTVSLEDKFMYCNEYNKYMVFYNGRKLGSDHFRLTLPVRDTTPFYDFNIYLTLPIKSGDRLDVIYVPSLMHDVTMIATAPVSGDITLSKDILNYGLSTDLYMIWVNGKKIPASHISDVYSTDLKINTDEKSIKTLCVTKYSPDIDVLSNPYKENTSKWDSMKSYIDNIYAMLGINETTLTNTEADIYAEAIDVRAIMYELVREQFMMNPNVDTTGPFIYDYQDVDNTIIEGYDSAGNAILSVADSNKTNNLDNVARPWP